VNTDVYYLTRCINFFVSNGYHVILNKINISVAPASRWAVLYQLILQLIKSCGGKYQLHTAIKSLLGIKMLRLRDTVEKVQVHG
jgi:hypothetical protein